MTTPHPNGHDHANTGGIAQTLGVSRVAVSEVRRRIPSSSVTLFAVMASVACNTNNVDTARTQVQVAPPSSDDTGAYSSDTNDAGAVDASRAYRITVLRTDTFVEGEHTYPVTFARIDRPDGGRTYVQWVASDRPGARGAVLATLPYVGIDWSGEEVDERWASYPLTGSVHLDVDGPSFAGKETITYETQTPLQVDQQGGLHLLNGLSVLFVFGRFYAGGSIGDEVEDMKAGTFFLAEQPEVDHGRIGVFGGSWGGFEAIYASAFGDARVRPVVTVAAYPPVDFPSWVGHIESRQDPAKTVLLPYLRRIRASVKGDDYSGFRFEDLCGKLPAATFVLHDDLDDLVPVAQSRGLASRCGADALYWPRTGTVDPTNASHGPLLYEVPDVQFPSWYTYAHSYLHTRLVAATEPLLEVVDEPALVAQLTNVRNAQARGEAISYLAPRLRELLRPVFIDARTKKASTGPELVSRVVNSVWKTNYTAETIANGLAAGLPSAPTL